MTVVKTLSGCDAVIGLTCLGDELFILHERDDNQVEVYSAETYPALRQFTVHGLVKHFFHDMISCAQLNCLYISDPDNSCIHKSKPSGEVIAKWPLSAAPYGLSLTPSNNILVICPDSCKLLELCSESGKCIRQVQLQSDIRYLMHAIQLTAQYYFLSYTDGDKLARVCVVDVDGQVSPSYGRHPGFDVTQLNGLYHMTTDQHNFIFVGDIEKHRVVLLSPSLELVRHIDLQQEPIKLYLDRVTRRLYVGHQSGDVTIIQV